MNLRIARRSAALVRTSGSPSSGFLGAGSCAGYYRTWSAGSRARSRAFLPGKRGPSLGPSTAGVKGEAFRVVTTLVRPRYPHTTLTMLQEASYADTYRAV